MPSFTTARGRALALVGLLGSVPWARADLLTYYFEGHVTRLHELLALDDSVYIGAPFSGSYTFDPEGVGDSYPNTPNVGFYRFGRAGRMSAHIGIYEFITPDLGILVWNDLPGGDLYEAISNSGFAAAGYDWDSMSLILVDWSGSALDSDALPLYVPELTDFPNARSFQLELPGGDVGIGGALTSLTPEPGSMALLGFGATTLLVARRQSSRSAQGSGAER